MMWASQKEYFKDDENPENTFQTIFYFHGVLGTVVAIVLLSSSRLRIALYVILTLLIANSALLQFCTYFLLVFL